MKKVLALFSLVNILFLSFVGSAVIGGAVCVCVENPSLFVPLTGILFASSIVLPTPNINNTLFVVFTEGICEKVQSSLIEIMGSDAPSLKRSPVGYVEALQSSQNTTGVMKIPVDPGNGKNKTVRLKFIQRATEADVKETDITDCSTEVEREPFEQIVSVTRFLRSPGLKFNENEMRKLCEPDSQFMAGVMSAEMDAVVKVLNKKLLAIQNANFGKFNPNLNPNYKDVVLITGDRKKANYDGETDILQAFEDIDATGRPILVGAGNLYKYTRHQKVGCCNLDGVDVGRTGDFDFFYDRYAEPIIGGTHFIGLVPGAVQLLTWNKYVGDYAKENQVFSHGTVKDPKTGIVFDMKWHYNDCNDSWALFFGLNYDMYFQPSNVYAAGDELSGVNGSLNFRGLYASDYCC